MADKKYNYKYRRVVWNLDEFTEYQLKILKHYYHKTNNSVILRSAVMKLFKSTFTYYHVPKPEEDRRLSLYKLKNNYDFTEGARKPRVVKTRLKKVLPVLEPVIAVPQKTNKEQNRLDKIGEIIEKYKIDMDDVHTYQITYDPEADNIELKPARYFRVVMKNRLPRTTYWVLLFEENFLQKEKEHQRLIRIINGILDIGKMMNMKVVDFIYFKEIPDGAMYYLINRYHTAYEYPITYRFDEESKEVIHNHPQIFIK